MRYSPIVFVLSAITLRVISTPTANFSYVFIACYALFGRAQAIHALALSWLFSMLSPGLAPEATFGSVGRYAVIAAAGFSVFWRSGFFQGRFQIRYSVLTTLLLGGFLAIHSLWVSPVAEVSLLKALSWVVVMATVLSAWQSLALQERNQTINTIIGGLTLVMIASLPLLVLPLGYLRNGTGFQGILSHPQVFGPTMAMLGAWSVSQLLRESRPSWSFVCLFGVCLFLILRSESRTAGLGLILALGFSVILVLILSGQHLRHSLPGLQSKRFWAVACLALFLGALTAPNVGGIGQHFLSKSGRAGEVTGILEAFDVSRGRLLNEMSANIAENPLMGIGFGIASEPGQMIVERDPVFGLPVGAPIEKGITPLAVLEEVGIVGFVFFCMWLWPLFRQASLGGITPLAITCTILLVNMGENIFFSPGGMGLLLLVFAGWAFSSNNRGCRTKISAC